MMSDRKIDSWNDDRECERESRHKRKSAEHQPGLVAVPDRRDRVHDQIARIPVGRESIEYAHAQIEAVQEHIEKDADAKHERPGGHEIKNGLGHSRCPVSVDGSAWTGCAGRPLSIGSGSVASSAGPSRTSLDHQREAGGEHDEVDHDNSRPMKQQRRSPSATETRNRRCAGAHRLSTADGRLRSSPSRPSRPRSRGARPACSTRGTSRRGKARPASAAIGSSRPSPA